MKVDKGFELNYWKLSYRRKIIRTLWWGLLVIMVPIICFLTNAPTTKSLIISISALILWSIQLFYNAIRYYIEAK
ncbi:MAG: hypothetical protein PHF63_10320 [Herbinix sp.]|nr:hypothetical protein [Herbinix sp.]